MLQALLEDGTLFAEKERLETLCKTQNLEIFTNGAEEVETLEGQPWQITTQTQATVMYCKYRIVFALDISPSVATLDWSANEILFGRLNAALEMTLRILLEPLQIPQGGVTVIHVCIMLKLCAAEPGGSYFGCCHCPGNFCGHVQTNRARSNSYS